MPGSAPRSRVKQIGGGSRGGRGAEPEVPTGGRAPGFQREMSALWKERTYVGVLGAPSTGSVLGRPWSCCSQMVAQQARPTRKSVAGHVGGTLACPVPGGGVRRCAPSSRRSRGIARGWKRRVSFPRGDEGEGAARSAGGGANWWQEAFSVRRGVLRIRLVGGVRNGQWFAVPRAVVSAGVTGAMAWC
jgi:hypothetical protein